MLQAIKNEIDYVKSIEQGRWIDLFSAKYRRRTLIITVRILTWPFFIFLLIFAGSILVLSDHGRPIRVSLSPLARTPLSITGRLV